MKGVALGPFNKGLNLRDANAPGSWADCLDVEAIPDGGVRARPTWTNEYTFATPAFVPTLVVEVRQVDGSKFDSTLFANLSFGVHIRYQAGTWTQQLADATVLGQNITGACVIGSAGVMYVVMCRGDVAKPVTWSVAGGIRATDFGGTYGPLFPYFAASCAWENRLMLARNTANPGRVWFSDIGQAFNMNNYLDVGPNDGQRITAMVSSGSYTYVFKDDRFFVFYGTATTSTGAPDLQYRSYDVGVGATDQKDQSRGRSALSQESGTIACGYQGACYFVGRRGLYVSRGGPPEFLGDAIEPMFVRLRTGLYSDLGGVGTTGYVQSVSAASGVIYMRMVGVNEAGTATAYLLTYNLELKAWAVWSDIGVPFMANNRIYGAGTVAVPGIVGPRYDGSGAVLAGSPRLLLAANDLGAPGQAKAINAVKVWGSGTLTAGFAIDQREAATITEAVTFGASRDIVGDATPLERGAKVGWMKKSQIGEMFGLQLSGPDFYVQRAEALVEGLEESPGDSGLHA